jgi:hypothetical protein
MTTFLESNLTALFQDVKGFNANSAEHIRNHAEKASTENIHIYETNVKDLTILYEDKYPLHSMDGAVAEAEKMVEDQVCYGKHSMNIVFGLGLGYVLKPLVQALRSKNSQAKVIIYEKNLDMLYFTLSHINLEAELADKSILLFTDSEPLWQYVETHLVQGDGIGMMMLPGMIHAFGERLKPVVEKLKLHADNAVRNAKLLQGRSRLWTDVFLQNASYLPTMHSVTHLRDAFEGKTALMCGAGPSLNDVLPHIHAVRDKLVICCVSGAVKAFKKHGITPDFIFGMDYYGPAKQMEGLEDPMAESHIITGPSSDTFMLNQPCKSRWAASLKYNDQYTTYLNNMFDEKTHEYHTGGTVAFYMFLVAVDLGFRTMILAGQDLALRGMQVYATGEEVELSGKYLVSKELNNRATELHYVEDWHGNQIMTQEDYRHFKYHFDTIQSKIRVVFPEFNVYNCSVGGAKIEDMENLPIEELLPRLDLQERINVDAIVEAGIQASQEQSSTNTKAERLCEALKTLKKHTQETIEEAKTAIQKLDTLKILKSNSWTEASERYSDAFNRFSETLEAEPLLNDTFYHEQLVIYQAYNDFAETEAEHRENFTVDAQYLKTMVKLLQEAILPPVEAEIVKLETTYDLIKDDELTFSIKANW